MNSLCHNLTLNSTDAPVTVPATTADRALGPGLLLVAETGGGTGLYVTVHVKRRLIVLCRGGGNGGLTAGGLSSTTRHMQGHNTHASNDNTNEPSCSMNDKTHTMKRKIKSTLIQDV